MWPATVTHARIDRPSNRLKRCAHYPHDGATDSYDDVSRNGSLRHGPHVFVFSLFLGLEFKGSFSCFLLYISHMYRSVRIGPDSIASGLTPDPGFEGWPTKGSTVALITPSEGQVEGTHQRPLPVCTNATGFLDLCLSRRWYRLDFWFPPR